MQQENKEVTQTWIIKIHYKVKGKFILIFILLLSFGRKKEVAEPATPSPRVVNWNEQFIGTYEGTWTSYPYGMATGSLYSTDTTFTIGLDSDNNKNTTSFSTCPIVQFDSVEYCAYFYHGSLCYRNDSIFYGCMNGGLGGGINESFKGKKL